MAREFCFFVLRDLHTRGRERYAQETNKNRCAAQENVCARRVQASVGMCVQFQRRHTTQNS